MDFYSARYSDANGAEETTIANDGEILRMAVRGLVFSGVDFDSLGPPDDSTTEQLRQFQVHRDYLCSCCIECQIPIRINDQSKESIGTLLVEMKLGDPVPSGGLDDEELHIVLEYNHEQFAGSGRSAWFEDELLEIQQQLPDSVFMRACINCLYSDYSPVGHGLFGCMMCFRNLKAEYVKVTTKEEFWSVHERYDRLVQETYWCPEFRRRVPGTGYRG